MMSWKFNLFAPIIFILGVFNFAVDTPQLDQIQTERRGKHSIQSDKSELDNGDRKQGTEQRGFIKDVAWMLKYNQIGPMLLLINLTHIFLLAYETLKAILWASLPRERDAITNEFKHPLLRHMDHYYLVESFGILGKNDILARIGGPILLYFFIQRSRTLYIRYRTAQIDRNGHRKRSTPNLNMAYIMHLRSDFIGWLKLFCNGLGHKCQFGGTNRRRKESSADLDNMSRFDRLYRFNLIDFDACHRDNECLRDREKETGRNNDLHKTVYHQSLAREISGPVRYLFTIVRPNRRIFLPRPSHRIDPNFLALLVAICTCGMVLIALWCFVGTALYVLMYAKDAGLEQSDILGTLWQSMNNLWQQPRKLMTILDGSLVIIICGLNSIEIAHFVISSFIFLSRTTKVIKLLEWELNFYYNYRKRYNKFIKFNNPEVDRIQEMMSLQSVSDQARCKSSHLMRRQCPIRNSKLGYLNIETKKFDNHQNQSQIFKFNGNIRYLMHLTGVLVDELNDLKSSFTFFINLTTCFGTFSAATAIHFLALSSDISETIFIIFSVVATLLPFADTLILGSISESLLRKICRLLMPLMINEAHLIEQSTAKRIKRLHSHLLIIENRAFVLLGCIPLDFGSLVPILTSMATVTSLLQRYFR